MGVCCSCLSPDDVHPSKKTAAQKPSRGPSNPLAPRSPTRQQQQQQRGEKRALLASSSDDDSEDDNQALNINTPTKTNGQPKQRTPQQAGAISRHNDNNNGSMLLRGSIRNTPHSLLSGDDESDPAALRIPSSSSSTSLSSIGDENLDLDDEDDDDDNEDTAQGNVSIQQRTPPRIQQQQQPDRKEKLYETPQAQAVEAMLVKRAQPVRKSASFEDFLLADFQAEQSQQPSALLSASTPTVAQAVSNLATSPLQGGLPITRSRPNMHTVRTKTGSVYELIRQDMTPFFVGKPVSGVAGQNALCLFFTELMADAFQSRSKALIIRIEAVEPVCLYASKDEAPTLLSYGWTAESVALRGVHVATINIEPSALQTATDFSFFIGVAAKSVSSSFTFNTQLESVVLRTGEQVNKHLTYGSSKSYLIQNPCFSDEQSCRTAALALLLTTQSTAVLPFEVRVPHSDEIIAASFSSTPSSDSDSMSPSSLQQLRFALRADVENYLVTVTGWTSVPVAYSLTSQLIKLSDVPRSEGLSGVLHLPDHSQLDYGTSYAGTLSRTNRTVHLTLPMPDLSSSWNTVTVLVESTQALMFEVAMGSQTIEGRFRLVEGTRYLGTLSLSPTDLLKESDATQPWVLRVTGISFGSDTSLPFVVVPRLKSVPKQPALSQGLLTGSLLYSLIDFYAFEFDSPGTLTLDLEIRDSFAQTVYDESDQSCVQLYVRHNECPPHHKFPLIQSIDFDHHFPITRTFPSSPSSSSSSSSSSSTASSSSQSSSLSLSSSSLPSGGPVLVASKKIEVRVQAGLYFLSIICSNSFKIDYSIQSTFATLAQPSQQSLSTLTENVMSKIAPKAGWTYCSTTISNTDLTALFFAVSSLETDMPLNLFVQQGGLPSGASTEFQGVQIIHPEDSSKMIHFVCLSPRELKMGGDGLWYLGLQVAQQVDDRKQIALGYFLSDSCTSLTVSQLPVRSPIAWATVPLRRWTYFDIEVDTDATKLHLLVEYVCSQQLVVKLKKGSIPSPITYDTPDPNEIEGPMSKISPWWRGALLIPSRILEERQSGKWYIGLQGVPRAHALLGLRVSFVPITDEAAPLALPEGVELLSPEIKILQ